MVNGKDYNYFPRSIGQQLKVLKSIERTYSGNSRFVDINDPTGTYKPVNVLATDGYLYMDTDVIKSTTSSVDGLTAEEIYTKYIEPKFSLKELSNVYYQNYAGTFIPENDNSYYYWIPMKIELGQNTMVGVLTSGTNGSSTIAVVDGKPAVYSDDVTYSDIIDIFKGDVVCFEEYIPGRGYDEPTENFIWARIEKTTDKTLTISEVLDTNKCWKIRKGEEGSKDYSKLMAFNTDISSDVKSKIISELSDAETNTSFGITYVPPKDTTIEHGQWQVIDESDTTQPYLVTNNLEMVLANEYLLPIGAEPEYPLDMKVANWFIRVNYTNNGWEICSQESKIIFGSVDEASFFFNTSNKDASNDGYFITKDVIKILKNQEYNKSYTKDYYWKPYNVIKYSDGYIDTQEFCCEALDGDKDAVIDVPTQYDELTENMQKLIFLKSESSATMEFLNYNDLYQEYLDNLSQGIQKASYISSMWNNQRTLKSGYYYSYHKINQIIPAYGKPKEGTEHLWTPRATVLLSNGITMAFNNADYMEGKEKIDGSQTYDFVDYIHTYDSETDKEYYFEEYDEEGNLLDEKLVEHGFLYYYDHTSKTLELKRSGIDYVITDGIKNVTFLWKHYPTTDYVIDPCPTNIIDMFVLTNTYYEEVQEWIQNGKKGVFPKAPSAYELKGIFQSLEANKMISDAVVWHPITYKLVFGQNGDVDTHCIFKVIKSDETMSDNEVKKQVIQCVDDYFRNMEVGETFYFTQLSTYVQNKLVDLIKTIVIVPTDTSNKFGDLFQIKCDNNEIILSTASLDDVEIISTITSDNIRM